MLMHRYQRKLIIEQRINELKRLEAKRMDPTTTYDAMWEAWREGDKETAREHATNLKNWLDRNGFAPAGISKEMALTEIGRILK